jgi:hypothetical protein
MIALMMEAARTSEMWLHIPEDSKLHTFICLWILYGAVHNSDYLRSKDMLKIKMNHSKICETKLSWPN